jgi:hypothetical protein
VTNERFNELLQGPLHHPMPMFVITRLSLALFAVVQATGDAGEKALEEHCAARERQDQDPGDEEDAGEEWSEEDIPF